MPSSLWETGLVCTYSCCAQEHLLLIRGVQLCLQSKALAWADFSPLPSGFSSQLEFSRCKVVFTQRKDHLCFVDAQRNKTIQLRADFSSSLSCLGSGVGFVAVPGKLAEAAGPYEVRLSCGWSSFPLLLSCRSVFVLCRNVSLSEKQQHSPVNTDNKHCVVWCFSSKSNTPLPTLCCHHGPK